jgi:predicted porin
MGHFRTDSDPGQPVLLPHGRHQAGAAFALTWAGAPAGGAQPGLLLLRCSSDSLLLQAWNGNCLLVIMFLLNFTTPTGESMQVNRRTSSALAAFALVALMSAPAAQAQSSVSAYGLIDMSVDSLKSPGGTAMKKVDSGQMSTSYWGFKGAEDLGGGMTAQFVLEGFLRNDSGSFGRFNGDPMFARNSYVALGTNTMGSVSIGRNTTSLFVNTLIFNAFGDSFGFSPVIRQYFISGASQVSGDTGWNDSVKYNSANYGGLSFTAMGALGEGNGGRNTGLSALYFGGDLGLGFAWQSAKKGATEPDTTTWQLSGSYKLGDAKLYAQYGKVDNTTTNLNYKHTGLGADYTIGAGKVLVQWAHVGASAGPSLSTFSVGYDYFLSKRTDLYGVFMSERKTGLSTGSSYGVGVRTRF